MGQISTSEAANRLGASRPTVRHLLEAGKLTGSRLSRGSRFIWEVDEDSVEALLSREGRIDGKRRRAPSKLDGLIEEVGALRQRLDALASSAPAGGGTPNSDDLRAQVVDLQVALARTREVLELQQQADAERATQVEHLLAAATAGERAEALRREALGHLDEALAGFTRPGHLGSLASGQR